MQKQLNEELFANLQCISLILALSGLKYFDIKNSISPNFENVHVFQSLLTSRLDQLILRFQISCQVKIIFLYGQIIPCALHNFSRNSFPFLQ